MGLLRRLLLAVALYAALYAALRAAAGHPAPPPPGAPAALSMNAPSGPLAWWVGHTPLCAGPLCVNIFDDHANLELHWAGR